MRLPTINHRAGGWESISDQGWCFSPSGAGFPGGHIAWPSKSVLVPRPWSTARPSFGSGIQSDCGVRGGERDVGLEFGMQERLSPL